MGVDDQHGHTPHLRPDAIPSDMFSRPTTRRPISRTNSMTPSGRLPKGKSGRGSRASHTSELSVPVGPSPSATPLPGAALTLTQCELPEVRLESSESEDEQSSGFPGPNDPERACILYRAACRRLCVNPCKKFLRSIASGTVNIAHRGIGPDDTKAVAIGLVTSMAVTELHLQGNAIGPQGMKYILDMAHANGVLKVLDVSDNLLETEGAECLARMMEESDTISKLRAASNQFDENAAVFLAAAIRKNTTIRILDLSKNEFHEKGGVLLGKAIGDNDILESVNLSWNHLRNRGIFGIAEGVKENVSMKTLDLSMNGVGRDGAEALGHALKHNRMLKTLKMRACRINVDGLVLFFNRMSGNETLKSVDISENPITNEDAIIGLRSILCNPSLAIMDVALDNVSVSSEFLEVREQIREFRPDFKVSYGSILRVTALPHHLVQEVLTPPVGDPLEMLFKFVKDNNLRIMDFFVQLDIDKSCAVSHDEFKNGIIKTGMNLSEHQMDMLIEKLDADGDGEIDFGELIDAFRRYQRKQLKKSGLDSNSGSRPGSHMVKTPLEQMEISATGYEGKKSRSGSQQNSRPGSPFAVDMSQPLGNPNELVLNSEYLKASQREHRPSVHDVHFQVLVLSFPALQSALTEIRGVEDDRSGE